MSALALSLIAEAKRTRATYLDLGNCGLTELPNELFELTWLEELSLSSQWKEYSFEKKKWEQINTQNKGGANNINFISSKIKLLNKLKKLFANNQTELSNLNPLSDLITLKYLRLSLTEVSDLSPLSKLTDLQQLWINGAQKVSDLSPLSNLTALQYLDISLTEVSDLSPLSKLTDLQRLWINSAQKVSDLSPLSNLTALQQLNINSTLVSDLSPLSNLTALQQLNINSTQVRDLSPLSNLTALQQLDISQTQISNLSPLSNLTALQQLDINSTKVYDISPLTNLMTLQQLDVNSTQVSDLSPLSNLTALQKLNVSKTQISNLSPLSNLTALQQLDVSSTQVSSLSPLSNLTALQKLNVSRTQISNLSPLSNLTALQQPDISFTQVSNLSHLKGIIERNISSTKENNDISIIVQGCPLTNPPIEIVRQGNAAILNYWQQLEAQGGTEDINESKLIIVGEGATGKTTLFEKLRNPKHNPLKNPTPETHGINILEGLALKNGFHANIWDFGGQELQYMTHQFFLTPRALYVLMMDARKESPNLSYWFKIISLLGRESDSEKAQVLLVFNKRKGSTGIPQYEDLLAHYKNDFDYEFMEVDFADNNYRWEHLKNCIEERLSNLAISLPKQWKPIREALRAEALTHPHISMERFSAICSLHQVVEEESQLLGSRILHKLGQILHFDEIGLRNHLILSPKWAVEAVYCFLGDENIEKKLGHFTEDDFIKILNQKGYKRADADLILQIMTRNHFDICYKSKDGNYVAAQLLPDNRPAQYKWYPEVAEGGALQFRYQYPTMPKGLISRLIVRLSEHIEQIDGVEIVWKKGAILEIEKDGQTCRVLLQEDDAESKTSLRQIKIEALGEPSFRKYALQKVRDEVEELHKKWFRNIHVDEIVPCCCKACSKLKSPEIYVLKDLLKLMQYSSTKQCLTGNNVSIQQLLEGIYTNKELDYKNVDRNNFIHNNFNAVHIESIFQTKQKNEESNDNILRLEKDIENEPNNIDKLFELGKEYDNLRQLEKAAEIENTIKILLFEKNRKKPVNLNALEIEKINQFESIKWNFEPNINILLGKNGYGKSYLLRFIAALLQDDTESLKDHYFYNNKGKAQIQIYQESTAKEINYPNEVSDEPKIPIGKVPVLSIPDVRTLSKSFSSLTLINDSLVEGELYEIGSEHFIHQLPYDSMIQNRLFVIGKDLLIANAIYQNIENTIRNSAIIQLIHKVIESLGDTNFKIVNIRDYEGQAKIEIEVITEGSSNILPLQAVSQGTISVIAILSLIYSFLKSMYKYVDEKELLQQKAIVIIDEIDAHLHPSWQQKIVGLLRENFPNIQFILTAHSPLVVAGCYEGEVAVLSKNKGNESFELIKFDNDFIGWETADLYETVFKIEDEDYTFLKYATQYQFRNEIAKEIAILENIQEKTLEQETQLSSLYKEQYYIRRYAEINEKRIEKSSYKRENEILKDEIKELKTQIEKLTLNKS